MDITPTIWLVLAVAVVIQLALMVTAIRVVVRTPAERLVLGKKWPWILLSVVVNLIGPVLVLALSRKPAPAVVTPAPSAAQADVARSVSSLYGDRK